jgi:DHA1 family bicyclomycin/chloramphenicol resistance-like MFS transporter
MTDLQDRAATATPAAASEGNPPSRALLALVLGAFVAVGPLTIDMYLPALPTITAELGTTSAMVQLTLTGTLVGLALGQLVLGPLSDAIGRRTPLLAGTALYVVASLLILVAPTIEVLGVLRFLQGVGTAAGAVVALAVVRDLYTGARRPRCCPGCSWSSGPRRCWRRPSAANCCGSPAGAASSPSSPSTACC